MEGTLHKDNFDGAPRCHEGSKDKVPEATDSCTAAGSEDTRTCAGRVSRKKLEAANITSSANLGHASCAKGYKAAEIWSQSTTARSSDFASDAAGSSKGDTKDAARNSIGASYPGAEAKCSKDASKVRRMPSPNKSSSDASRYGASDRDLHIDNASVPTCKEAIRANGDDAIPRMDDAQHNIRMVALRNGSMEATLSGKYHRSSLNRTICSGHMNTSSNDGQSHWPRWRSCGRRRMHYAIVEAVSAGYSWKRPTQSDI